MDALALNDNAVTDAADMLQRQLTLAGGDVEELEEAAEDAAQSDWAELPDELVEKVLTSVLEMLQARPWLRLPGQEALTSFGPLPRCGWCALRGRLCMMRW
jgi:hypothetical protein